MTQETFIWYHCHVLQHRYQRFLSDATDHFPHASRCVFKVQSGRQKILSSFRDGLLSLPNSFVSLMICGSLILMRCEATYGWLTYGFLYVDMCLNLNLQVDKST